MAHKEACNFQENWVRRKQYSALYGVFNLGHGTLGNVSVSLGLRTKICIVFFLPFLD